MLAFTQIFFTNMFLFEHLSVLGGRRQSSSEKLFNADDYVAIAISLVWLFCLIAIYGALYFVDLPCLHFDNRFEPLGRRILDDFVTNLYISAVTITTLGHGDLSPKGNMAGELIASIEAINGLVAFGVLTGALVGLMERQKEVGNDRPAT